MLEIVLLIYLCKKMGDKLRAKGRKPFPFQLMVVGFWFVSEFLGAVVVSAVLMIMGTDPMPLAYVGALVGAAMGAAAAFFIASRMPPLVTQDGHQPGFPVAAGSSPYTHQQQR